MKRSENERLSVRSNAQGEVIESLLPMFNETCFFFFGALEAGKDIVVLFADLVLLVNGGCSLEAVHWRQQIFFFFLKCQNNKD